MTNERSGDPSLNNEAASIPALAHLTDDESNFIFNVEVLGLPSRRAAQLAGMVASKQYAPHIVQAREVVKQQVRGTLNITKEDVVHGYRDAIDRARILGEPMTEIVGWEKIAKLLGYDAPKQINVQVNAVLSAMNNAVKSMNDAELVAALGAEDIIDADFYTVNEDGEAADDKAS